MTPAEQIAAEVAARYRCTVSPDVVQIIPRGVSGVEIGANDSGTWKQQRDASFRAMVLHRQRIARLDRAAANAKQADAAAQKARSAKERAAKAPLAVPVDVERLKLLGAIRREKVAGPFVPLDHWLQLLSGRPEGEIAAALGMTMVGTHRALVIAGLVKKASRKSQARVSEEARAAKRKSQMHRCTEIRVEKQMKRQAQVAELLAQGKKTRAIMAICGTAINTARKDIAAVRKQVEAAE